MAKFEDGVAYWSAAFARANRSFAYFSNMQQSARSFHLAITPLADVRVPHPVHLLLEMQSSSTLGAIWTGANGVRVFRFFMFPVKSAGLHKRQFPCDLAATRHPCITARRCA